MPIRTLAEKVKKKIIDIEVFAVVDAELIPVDEAEKVDSTLLVRLTDEEGHVEEFGIDFWEYADEQRFKEIINKWITDIFPKRKAMSKLHPKDKAKISKEIKEKIKRWLNEYQASKT